MLNMANIGIIISMILLCNLNMITIHAKKIKFTRRNYHVSVFQDQGVRRYVTHSEFQMGIFKPSGNETVSFKIREKSEIVNTFDAESYLLGDFCYLRIRTKFFATINREGISEYNLTVMATVANERASTQVHVRVLDRNDNCPIFSKEIFDFVANEDISLATIVGIVTATDADEGIHSEVFFYGQTVSNDGVRQRFPFSLDPLSGAINPTERLQQFAGQKLTSKVSAMHRGDPSIINCDVISQALVVVTVLSSNRYSPTIVIQPLTIIFDPQMDNYPYAEVIVSDEDDDKNDNKDTLRLSYPLAIKNSSHSTIIFSLSPTATVNKHLLKIRPSRTSILPDNAIIVLEAHDLGSSSRSTLRAINIPLLQFKDMSLLSIPSLVSLNIPENAIVNSTVLLLRPFINCTNRDNIASLKFRLLSGNDGALHGDISVSSSGVVSVRGQLNAEDINFRERKVMVGVSLSQWSTLTKNFQLHIIVGDINEYQPVVNNNGSSVSVAENALIGSTLFYIDAYDPDVSRTNLSYYLFDEQNLPFTLATNERNRVILKTPLDAETMPRTFRLRVLIGDSGLPLPRNVVAHYDVDIGDVNEFRPEFPFQQCNISISRHLPFDSRLGYFLAEDLDRDGRQNIRITLASISLQEPCVSVNAQTGSVVLLCSLRNRIFNKVANFIIELQANDGPMSSKKLSLNVTVVEPEDPELKGQSIMQQCDNNDVYSKMLKNLETLQKNYYKTNTIEENTFKISGTRDLPRFVTHIREVVHLREEVPLGHVVLGIEMKTSDENRDPYESVFVFGLWSAGNEQAFLVRKTGSHSAQVIVGDRLDRERVDKYSLTLAVCDTGHPSYCTMRTILVQVEDINDQYPHFVDSFQMPIEIAENFPVNKKIIQVEATDADEYNILMYRLVNFKDVFRVHKRTGWLKLRRLLDREERDKYTLVVTASDHARQGPSLTSTVTINIVVADINDNRPVFSKSSYYLSLPVDLPVGSFLLQLHATDADTGSNAKLRYTLHGKQSECFKCDETTGTIHLICTMSTLISYRIIALAEDSGQPQLFSTQSDFIVQPQQVSRNMYPPILRESLIHASVTENSFPGILITTLQIVDADKSPGQHSFTISGRSSGISRFKINNDGEIRTISKIDREMDSSFWLFVYVESGNEAVVHRTLAEIFVEVLDENDNWPMPDKAYYSANVPENLQGAVDVLTIHATDADSADNKTLKFKIISGDPMGHFSVSQAGTIRTTERSIDRESFSGGKSTCLSADSYDLKVSISDSGNPERITAVHVHVNIDDTNDNNPVFLNDNHFVFTHYLDTEALEKRQYDNKRILVGRVVAVDSDKDLNGTVRYTLNSGQYSNLSNSPVLLDLFTVDVETGCLYLTASTRLLNGSKNGTSTYQSYEVKVWAFDLGVPTLWSTIPATVKVRLIAINNSKEISAGETREVLHLAHDMPVSVLLRYDDCVGYELLSIAVVDSLDPTGLALEVAISEADSPFAIFWTKKGGMSRYQSEATLVIAQPLINYRDTSTLRLFVRNAEMILRRNLTINVKFYNKQAPVFATNNPDLVTVEVKDLPALPSVIFKVIAKPPELDFVQTTPSNWSQHGPSTTDFIVYFITESNDPDTVQQLFYLNSDNGDLSVVSPVQSHRGRTFQLIIVARGSRSSYTKINVHIADYNTMTPQFVISMDMKEQYLNGLKSLVLSTTDGMGEPEKSVLQHHIDRSFIAWFGWVDASAAVRTIVTGVSALDQDNGVNGVLTYSISNDTSESTYFSIDSNSGDMRVARDLNGYLNRVLFLNVIVRDNGSPSLYNKCVIAVHVRTAIPISKLPQMDKTQLELLVYENVPINTIVHCLKLRSDVYPSIPIQFFLLKTTPKDGNWFGVTRTTGCIITSSVIDKEIIQEPINLEVQVQLYTGQSAAYNSVASVKVHIADVNDNAPKFISPLQMNGIISESANPGSVIFFKSGVGSDTLMKALIIQVEDPDEGENGTIDFSITSPAESHFEIDGHTGVLSLALPIDREVYGDFVTLRVQLSDRGTPPLMSHSILEIRVEILDENDCAPKFEKDFYIQNLLVPTYANAHLLQFRVTDPDRDTKIAFSILDGNNEGFFSLHSDNGWLTINADTVPKSNQLRRVLLLNIRASDGLHVTQCNVTIYCIDDAVRQPLPLEKNSVAWNITENEINVPHLVLPRTKLSYFYRSHRQIRYVLLSLHPAMSLDQSLGIIKLTKSLDREKEPYFSLLILARGWDDSHGYINVSVTVTDVNDFKPIFLSDSYSFLVDVNSSTDAQSLKVKAIDLDAGNNGSLSYSVHYLRPVTDEIRFSINSTTGLISVLRNPVATMVGKRFSLMVLAKDGGEPYFSTFVNVVVDIVSHKSPLFESTNYSASIWEDASKNSIISTVHALSSTGHTILYTIASGNDDELFDLDFTTAYLQPGPCVVRLVGSLDYEVQSSHSVVITATDPSSSLSHSTTVFISVLDRHNEEPVFLNASYSLSISEKIPANTVIRKISLEISKTHPKSTIFSLQNIASSSYCDSSHFKINAVTGELSVVKELDFEKCETHLFWVAVIFKGGYSRSSKAIVKVIVIDENDNPPMFSRQSFDAVISAQSPSNSLVIIVIATDVDTNTKLLYKVLDEGPNFLRIDKHTGFVRFYPGLNSRVLLSQQKPVTFTVLVHDTVHSTKANVTVKLVSTNNNSPSFKMKVVHLTVLENSSDDRDIGSLPASDPDMNSFGSLHYRFLGGFGLDNFNLDRKLGTIKVKYPLDREQKKVYQLRAIVSDGGGKHDFSEVLIHVNDVNDNKPTFDQSYYEVTVSASQQSQMILQLQARDRDQDYRYRMVYRLVHPSPSLSPVTIDRVTGQVTLKPVESTQNNTNSSSTKQTLKVHSLLVQVCEETGVVYRSPVLPVVCGTRVPVTVNIFSQPLDNIPEVTCSLKSVSENNAVHQLVAVCRVSPSTFTKGKWSLIPEDSSSSYDSHFDIDSNLGSIRARKMLDYEQQPQYRLTVEYRDVESMTLATRSLVIDLIDQNDCGPIFDNSRYSISISEDISVGARLLQCKAVDFDLEGKDKIVYSINSAQNVSQVATFRIDELGWIYVTSPLDFERSKRLEIAVSASDSFGHVVNTTVIVSVLDVNDEPPYWASSSLKDRTEVIEDCQGCVAHFPRVVYRLDARDNDTPSLQEPLRYLISNQNTSPYHSFFSVVNNGEIQLLQALDAERITGPVELRILVSDGLHWSMDEFTLVISIQDVNDHGPLCAQQTQTVIISEDTKPGSVITTVKAVDFDISAKFNTLSYKLMECDDPYLLVVEPTTGAVIINAPLDREFKSRIKFKIEASDIGLKTCLSSVEIIVTDVNDNDPKFVQSKIAPIPENAPYGSVIGKMHAEDADAGWNRRIEYGIVEDIKSGFSVDKRTGIMRVTSALDREKVPVHKIIVTAADSGRPTSRTSSITVVIELLDVNDSPPQFVNSRLQLNVSEDANIGSLLLTIEAISEDLGQNAVIAYRIVGIQDQFRLNSSTGDLVLLKTLDYEQNKYFSLSVEASDGGVPSLSTTAVVTIHVKDVNDNRPIFPKQPYLFTLMENMPIGRLVGKVTALDPDSDQNGQLTYSLLGWSQNHSFQSPSIPIGELFRLQRDTGEIFLLFVPDREHQVVYSFNVSASDHGVQPLVSSAMVTIEIEDMNDNPPLFDKESYRFLIQVDRSGRIPPREPPVHGDLFEVGRLSISDKDGPTNTKPFLCTLLNTEGTALFSVKMDDKGDHCVLLVSGLLHLGSRNLIVQVTDNGLTTLSQRCRVIVDIIRLSNIPPEIEPLNVTHVYFHSFKVLKKEAIIARVLVKERSPTYDRLNYELILNGSTRPQDRYVKDLFRIDSSSGVIKTSDQLDSGLYPLIVRVTNGSLSTQRLVFIKIVALTQEMIDSACVIQVNAMKPDLFFARKFDQKLIVFLKRAMASKLAYILSAKTSPRMTGGREKRELGSRDMIDILVSVYDETENRFFRSSALVTRINNLIDDLTRLLEATYARAFNNVCSDKHVCVQGQCQTKIKFSPDESMNRFQVLGVTFSSPDFLYSSVCKCDKYFGGDRCQTPLNKCAHKPCGHVRVCRIDPTSQFGFVCECPAFKKGGNCDQVVEIENASSCLDEQCVLLRESDPVHFNGGGYLRWVLGKIGQSHRIDLSISFRLLQKPAPLFDIQWNSLRSLTVSISDKGSLVIQAGHGTTPDFDIYHSLRVITDGRWHSLRVSIVGVENIPDWWLHVVLDGLQPRLHSLDAWMEGDLSNQTIMLGARQMLLSDNMWQLLDSSVTGCFKDVTINGVKAPYQTLPESIQNHIVKVTSRNLNFGCSEKMLASYCGLGICQKAAICRQIDDSNVSYSCQCQGPFSGKHCTVFHDPCKFAPCLHSGRCQQVDGGYKCLCPEGLSGPQCQWGRACSSALSPCPRISTCIEHLISKQSSAAMCRCNPSFHGYLCQLDVDECTIRPPLCQPGKGVCHNTHGGYQCNCSLGYSGRHCEVDSLIAIQADTSSLGLSQFHIYLIIGVLACLFVLALLTVVVLVLRLKPVVNLNSRRKKDRNAVISMDPLYQIKAYSGDQCSRYSPASSMMASSIHQPAGYIGGFMVEPPPGTPGGRSQASYGQQGQGSHYRRLSQDAMDRMSLCSSSHGGRDMSTPMQMPSHYHKSSRGQMFLKPTESRQAVSPHSSTFSLVPCHVGPQQHMHLVPNRNSMMLYHGPPNARVVYDPVMIGTSNLSLHSNRGISSHWELNEELANRTVPGVVGEMCRNGQLGHATPMRQISADTRPSLMNGDIEHSIMSWSGQYNEDPILNREMISSQEMSFTETTDRSTAFLLPKRQREMTVKNGLPPVSSHSETSVSATNGEQPAPATVNGNKDSPSTASPSSTSIPSGTHSSDTKGTAPVCEDLVLHKKGPKMSPDSHSAEGTECDTDDIELDQQPVCPSTFPSGRHLQDEDVEDGLAAMPLLDSII